MDGKLEARLPGGNACADGRCWACVKRPVQLPEALGAGVEKDFAAQQSAEGEVAFPELQGCRGFHVFLRERLHVRGKASVFRAAERGRSGKMTRGSRRTTSQTRLRCQGDSCFQLWLSSDFPVDPQNDTKLTLLPLQNFVVRFVRRAVVRRKMGWSQKQRRGTLRLPLAKVSMVVVAAIFVLVASGLLERHYAAGKKDLHGRMSSRKDKGTEPMPSCIFELCASTGCCERDVVRTGTNWR